MATTARDIFLAFGYELQRSRGKWVIRKFGEEHPCAESHSLGQLIESIVPPPPVYGGPETVEEWACECVRASHAHELNPIKLAKAAHAAYRIKCDDRDIEIFDKACRMIG